MSTPRPQTASGPSANAGAGAPVAIIGASGALGYGLALRLALAAVPVVIGSRDAARGAEVAERLSASAPEATVSGLENAEAAAAAPTVVLSVPFRSQAETLTHMKDALGEGQLVIDATVPLAAAVGGRATRMLGVPQGSAAQQTREILPAHVRVVSALHTVSAHALTAVDEPLDEDVLICGDTRADKREAAELIERIDGLRCVDCGKLEMSRVTESLTSLMISMNGRYKTHTGMHITGLPEARWA
jgi:8-hydroxy-5-deazaflavin:NADPH oxidoreductase